MPKTKQVWPEVDKRISDLFHSKDKSFKPPSKSVAKATWLSVGEDPYLLMAWTRAEAWAQAEAQFCLDFMHAAFGTPARRKKYRDLQPRKVEFTKAWVLGMIANAEDVIVEPKKKPAARKVSVKAR
ncbi:MAG: hypothetical protein EON58_01250 [Alphaproteobacteria bacterium]|nr:MAG: hypothetical protein EON58_01250 [Alphaproteobacteria bacterium]